MLARYQPTALVIEDAREARSLRALSLESFVASVADVLVDGPVPLRTYSRRAVRAAFRSTGATTKDEIARVLVSRFPELAPRRPGPRKVWESEDARMSIFDALSFAATHLASGDG
jgi:Holliday junction resolvasome RuvABC endonuclease subunit